MNGILSQAFTQDLSIKIREVGIDFCDMPATIIVCSDNTQLFYKGAMTVGGLRTSLSCMPQRKGAHGLQH